MPPAKKSPADSYIHLFRNFCAVIAAMGVSVAEFARRADIERRTLAFRFSPLRDSIVRGTSFPVLYSVAKAAGCSMAFLHLTPDDAVLLVGSVAPDEDLVEMEPRSAAKVVAQAMRDGGVSDAYVVHATIVGLALQSRAAGLKMYHRLRATERR